MVDFNNIDDVLDFAIGEEQAAVDFYMKLAETSRNENIKKVFHEFAEEEMKHKARLMEVKVEQRGLIVLQQGLEQSLLQFYYLKAFLLIFQTWY